MQSQRRASVQLRGAAALNGPERACKEKYLGAPEVGDAEHELEDAVAARDDGRVGDGDGAAAVLGVADARKDDADHDCVHDQPHHRLHPDDQPGPPAVAAHGRNPFLSTAAGCCTKKLQHAGQNALSC